MFDIVMWSVLIGVIVLNAAALVFVIKLIIRESRDAKENKRKARNRELVMSARRHNFLEGYCSEAKRRDDI